LLHSIATRLGFGALNRFSIVRQSSLYLTAGRRLLTLFAEGFFSSPQEREQRVLTQPLPSGTSISRKLIANNSLNREE